MNQLQFFNSFSLPIYKLSQLGANLQWREFDSTSPCLWECITIGVQLVFLGILLFQILQNFVCWIWNSFNGESKSTDQAAENCPITQKLSISYRASVGCSFLILAIHVLMVFVLQNGSVSQCNSRIEVLSSEITRVIAWGGAIFAVFRVLRDKSVKYPWILRGWWFCSFVLLIVHVGLDAYFGNVKHLGVQDYAEFFSILPSIFLSGLSIYGRTNIVFNVHNGLEDPLLTEKCLNQERDEKDSPYGRATPFQLVTFSWLNPLFAVGYTKPLEQVDIPNVCKIDSAKFLSHSFDDTLNFVRKKNNSTKPSIYETIYLFGRKKAAINAVFAVISAATSYVGPYLIDDFVNFLTQKKMRTLSSGYLLALAFVGAKTIETIAQRQWIFGARQLGLRLRAALISHIYQKGLRLSNRSRQSCSSGEILNYMSVDIQRITDFSWFLNTVWMLPIQISLAMYILHTNLGVGSLGALAATLVVMSCNIPMTRIQKSYQTKIMEAKDNRMKTTTEVLRNMKTLKLQAWDTQYLQKLESLRKVEHHWLWKSLRLMGISAFVFWAAPTFISVTTFGVCVLLRIELTAGRVLSALATFRMLQDPIFNLPDLLSALAQGKVSADRVGSYLHEDEIQQDSITYVSRDLTEFDIEIENGKFSWDLETRRASLDQINLKVKRGMKVAVCGTVGSGKSSLLSCILGEIEKLSGTVKISVYQDADIYLLDDPFSAVDAHTGTQLFEDCLMGALKEKTIIYVTHQVEFLPAADLILVMQNGRIAQAGGFEELLKQNIGFEVLVGAHSQALESIVTVENSSGRPQLTNTEKEEDSTMNVKPKNSQHDLVQNKNSAEITDKGGKLVQEEEREREEVLVTSNYWIAWACPTTSDTKAAIGINIVLLVYSLLAIGGSLCVLVRAMLVAIVGLQTAQMLFTNMLRSILRAPMAFFDSTPTGRIINRASTDQSVLDLEMAMRLVWCALAIIQMTGTIVVMSQVAWEVFAIFIPITAACIWFQQYYTPTARELARLSGIQRTPILHHFAESLAGAATIRAFNQEDRFLKTNLGLIDDHSRPWFHNVSAMEWLSFRLNLLSNFVFGFSLVLLVTLPEGTINPSLAGLAVTYGINLNVLQATVIWNICNAENKIISVERILQYSKIKSEAPLVIENCRPPSNWPQDGTICFKNLQIRYADHLPDVLKNISCTFPGRKKVGVVGRTGSGKSTLIQAIFRIVEPREGSIIIDGVDICKIGLHDLRSRLSIIPQDPSMFEGTVRGNLDPLEKYTDQEIWEALDKCQLGALVRAKDERLSSSVVENGENWSVGQRQLFCLGRALLKKSSILVLDEATASIDSATDGIIQNIISQEFKDRTVVTVAHRIHTVIASDFVLVLSDGRIAEFDSPKMLLKRDDSFFSKLIKEYSTRSQNFNSLANQRHD
uniref:ABC-type xenobiotic transporter n=1 Tax=Cucumis sativus TaxID=3659 RepID=A0A0A0L975_CUCSA